MRTPEFAQGRCPVKRVIYMRLPHPEGPRESWTVSGTVNNQKRLQLNVNF